MSGRQQESYACVTNQIYVSLYIYICVCAVVLCSVDAAHFTSLLSLLLTALLLQWSDVVDYVREKHKQYL
jgi:hypothetical protein